MFYWRSTFFFLFAVSWCANSRHALHPMYLKTSQKKSSTNVAPATESSDTPTERILGGIPASEGSMAFMAKLFIENSQVFCGGTLISPNYLMTAAHCALHIEDLNATRVGLGTVRLDNEGGLWVGIESVVVHEDFSMYTGNDIAIIKLKRPVDYPPLIEPIRLYGADVDFDISVVIVAGWGWYSLAYNADNSTHSEKSPVCLFTGMPLIDSAWCNQTWWNYDHINVWDNEMCAGANGRGTWTGDSGGPLYQYEVESGEYYQAGITSFGTTWYYMQQGQIPSVYTRVSAHCDFIKTATNGEAVCGSVLPATPRPPSHCPLGWRPSAAVDWKCYYTFDDISGSFSESLAICSKLDSDSKLVSIQNGFENSAVADEFRAGGQYWIGLNATTDGVWGWIDGQNLTYTNWATGEPSQSTGCVIVDPSSMKWRVAACDDVNLAVCELFLV